LLFPYNSKLSHTSTVALTPQPEAKNSWLKLAMQEQNQLFFVLLNCLGTPSMGMN
jgi:hypothetical protein